jgi:hypothetical protein
MPSDEGEMTEPRPDRDEELEQIVDELDDRVMGEREAEDVPGKPSDRKAEQAEGSTDEPTA